VVTYAYDPANGGLRELSSISTLPDGFSGPSAAAEIVLHPSGKFLYASNRGPDSITVFSISPSEGKLTHVEFVPVNGKTPRNFAIDPTGHYLLAVGQLSDSMTSYAIDANTGKLTRLKQYPMGKNPNWVEIVNLP